MLKHNLQPCFQSKPGTSLPFIDMMPLSKTLKAYSSETSKEPLQYLNLIQGTTLMTPYSLAKKKDPQLSGFQKTHVDFTINNR
jgi:hypothetical protein